jgi:hypothetical protein
MVGSLVDMKYISIFIKYALETEVFREHFCMEMHLNSLTDVARFTFGIC